jgi:outer membrane protein assembly factor BamD
MYKKYLTVIAFITLGLVTSGCNSTKGAEEESAPTDPKALFSEGIAEINQGNYNTAISSFETLEKEHPASDLAPEAQVRRAYSQYLDGKFDDAIITAEDFTRQYPVHESAPYMYYLKALCYYDQIVDVGRDQHLSFKAIEALNELIARYPDSSYARDARLKVEYVHNILAGKEMEIGNFYQKKNHLIAALIRYKTVVEQYQTSIFTPEALYRMVEIYYTLGDEGQARKYAAVLGYNYPDNEWYKKAYALAEGKTQGSQRSWYHELQKIW